jgi:mannose-6-phosphate isomerase-like protein (cupin superfamily)
MRMLAAVGIVVLLSSPGWTQQATPPLRSDMTKVTHVKGADIPALVAKMTKDGNGRQALFKTAKYDLGVERRLQGPPAPAQPPLIHKDKHEVFYVLDGSATFTTGGQLVEPTSTDNLTFRGKTITGGTAQRMSKGDTMVIPAGLPHWFSEVQGSITLMQVYLPE